MAKHAGPYYRDRAWRTQFLAPGYPQPRSAPCAGSRPPRAGRAGFVAAKHGIAIGLSPTDLAFHRFVWSGLLLMPLVAKDGLGNLGGVGWPRGLVILVLAGPLQAITSYTGFTLAPLGHGAVIHPASAALGGTLLAFIVLHEPLTRARILGIAGIVLGLIVFRRRGDHHARRRCACWATRCLPAPD